MEEINYIEDIRESVDIEFTEFKKYQLSRTKEQIFDNFYQIHFYDELHNYLVFCDDEYFLDKKHCKALYEDKGHILSSLYDYYLKDEYSSINSYEDVEDLLVSYNKRYHMDILNNNLEAE